jgi:flagellar biosynthesis protein FlhA
VSDGTVKGVTKSAKTEIIVPVAIIGIILMMILPMPPWLIDAMISLSMAISVGVFLTALFIENALEFSAFPAFVLVGTLLRLSLNVATTRLILLHGGEGNGSAGSVVEAFGRFVVEGNVVVGLVVFLILTVINFVVITKGSGRVAEVAARFTLDAMPGKQMAIDADLSSGTITNDAAKKRRGDLEREADFYGAMDGASKFVHGDAIAGLLIMAINLVGGLVMGVVHGMEIAKAGETFSILSVGDALASQLPALLMSAASGIVVTRSATGDQLGRALSSQFFGRTRVIYITSAIVALLGVLPGMPMLPCFGLAGALVYLARKNAAGKPAAGTPAAAMAEAAAEKKASPQEEIDQTLAIHPLAIEVGYELVGIVDTGRGGTLLDRVAKLRKEVAKELGIVVPPVNVTDDLALPPGAYRILVFGTEIAKGECAPGRVLAIDATGAAPPIDGEKTVDPTFGLPAIWIVERDRELAEALGYTVVDHSTILATHLGEIVRNNAGRLLGRQEVQHLVDILAKTSPKLVDDVLPTLLSLGDVVRVLRNLVKEGVSIRDMRTILESLGELSQMTKDPEQMTEMCRERLAPQITARFKSDGVVNAMTLDPRLEQVLRQSLADISKGTGGALDPNMLKNVTESAERSMAGFGAHGASPLVVTAPDLRRYVRAILERKLPNVPVVSFREIDSTAPLRIVDRLAA